MRERNRKLGQREVSIRLYTLRDKKAPMFRAKEPDKHIVELQIGKCIVREWVFYEQQPATMHFNGLLNSLT